MQVQTILNENNKLYSLKNKIQWKFIITVNLKKCDNECFFPGDKCWCKLADY